MNVVVVVDPMSVCRFVTPRIVLSVQVSTWEWPLETIPLLRDAQLAALNLPYTGVVPTSGTLIIFLCLCFC